MKKIICIGECAVDIIFRNGAPVGSMPGSRIVNAAAILAKKGLPVTMASEAAADSVGNMVVDFLNEAGVTTTAVDRFTEGRTPILIYTTDPETGKTEVTRYESYPDDCFDIIWPRIDEDDIVVYGGFYAIDHRMRNRLVQLLQYADERKAIMIYLPGFLPQQESRITRIMPAILENLEFADVVITRDSDLPVIFNNADVEKCYHNNIDFYCRSLVDFDVTNGTIDYYNGSEKTSVEIENENQSSMIWNAGAIAGVVDAIFKLGITAEGLDTPDEQTRKAIIEAAATSADQAVASKAHDWQKYH
jgi:fructokinase